MEALFTNIINEGNEISFQSTLFTIASCLFVNFISKIVI